MFIKSPKYKAVACCCEGGLATLTAVPEETVAYS